MPFRQAPPDRGDAPQTPIARLERNPDVSYGIGVHTVPATACGAPPTPLPPEPFGLKALYGLKHY